MRADPIPHDIARDPVLDGRDSLRLVKLRLALTLITVALLPIAAVAPVVRAVAGEASLAHHLRLDAEANSVATKLGAELEALAGSAGALLADPAIVDASQESPNRKASTAASTRLGLLVRRPSGAVVGVALVVDSSVRAAAGQALDLARLPDRLRSGVVPGTGADAGSLLVIRSQPATKKSPARSIVATVTLAPIVAWAAPSGGLPGQAIVLVDGHGRPVAESNASFDAFAILGQVLDLATDARRDSAGEGSVPVDGLQGWTIQVAAPIPLAALPAEALAALAALLLLLVALTVWMARQILRPAAQLEASRSRLRELYESAREAALRDSLTGLGNHRSFQEAVGRLVDGSHRYNTPFALVLFDVDEFKRINDSRGHADGDQLLAELGNLIRTTIRHADAGYRVGGDEFAILLPHTTAAGAAVMMRRLLSRALEDRGVGAYRGPISFSAGISGCPEYATTRVELTAQADAALYRGKRAGRTVVTIYDPTLDHGHVDEGMRAELSSAISAIVEAGSLTPVYQPIVDLGSGVIVGYEGLVRVPRDTIFPHAGALFDAAEISGRVLDLDRAALDAVLAGVHDLDPTLRISLNMSPLTLEANEFNATFFLGILRRHGVPPERVVLELTERQAARDPERLGGVIRALQVAGVRIAADDVGAGNAGLRLLSQHRFDVVKIDLSLVQSAGQDQGLSVLTSLVQMAARLGAMTIAEGVETPEQLRTIRELGVTAAQGYLLGRPGREIGGGWIDLIALEEPSGHELVPVGEVPSRGGSADPRLAALARAAQVDDGPFASRSRSIAVLNTSSVSNE